MRRFERYGELPTIVLCYLHISDETIVLRSRNRAVTKHRAKLLARDASQLFERRRELTRREGGVAGDRRAAVPWANVLADIASENMTANAGVELLRNWRA
jgi:hypothetical protein